MDVGFLPLNEFQRIYFYRLVTLAILLVIGVLTLASAARTPLNDLLFVAICLGLMAGRFALEWRWVSRCGPAFIHADELVVSHGASHQQVPLASIATITSRHCWFMARRYRSWSDHLAVVQATLHNGERVYTLVESGVLVFPAGKQSVAALEAAVLAAKVKRAGGASQGSS